MVRNAGDAKAGKVTCIVQRMAALRIGLAYRTVSAVLVIAGTIPLDLLWAERSGMYKAKSV